MAGYFSTATFKFLRELKANNERDFFQDNKDRYIAHVREPALAFIRDFEAPLKKISPAFKAEAKTVGGSLFRIYNDQRFGNKEPYKTHIGIHFRHENGKSAHAPGFYLHLEQGECFVAAGSWRPPGPEVKKVRASIVDYASDWQRLKKRKAFRESFEFIGESLKRPPRGFDAEHTLIDDIKRKDFLVRAPLKDAQVKSPTLLKDTARLMTQASPLVEFICLALDEAF